MSNSPVFGKAGLIKNLLFLITAFLIKIPAAAGMDETRLNALIIDDDKLTDNLLLQKLAGLGEIESVIIHDASHLTDRGMERLASLPYVRSLQLSNINGQKSDFYARFTLEGFSGALERLSVLEKITFSGIPADFALQSISKNKELKDVYIEQTRELSANGTKHNGSRPGKINCRRPHYANTH